MADAKQFFVQHGEKVALGVALAASAYFVGMSLMGSDADATSKKIENYSKQIEDRIRGAQPPVEKGGGAYERVSREWAPVSLPKDAPRWTFHRVPEVKITRRAGPEPVVVTDPTNLRATATRTEIEVRWTPPPGRGPLPEGGEAAQAEIWGFVLYKWQKGEEKDKKRLFVAADKNTYLDKEFEPKTTYVYQLEAYYEHQRIGDKKKVPDVKGGAEKSNLDPKLEAPDLEGAAHKGEKARWSKLTNEASVTTPVNLQLVYRNWLGEKATIWVWQFRWDRWWGVKFTVPAGENIGGEVTADQLARDNQKWNDDHPKMQEFKDLAKQEMQKRVPPEKRKKWNWSSPYVLIGPETRTQGGKVLKLLILENQEVRMQGLGGIDWGIAYSTLGQQTSGDQLEEMKKGDEGPRRPPPRRPEPPKKGPEKGKEPEKPKEPEKK